MTSATSAVVGSAALRAELKDWERAFAAANGGRKANRNDIKKDQVIAAKYKEYNRLKSLEASSSSAARDNKQGSHASPFKQTDPDHCSKRHKHSPAGLAHRGTAATPQKSSKSIFETPSTGRNIDLHPAEIDPYDSPSVLRRLFSPSTHRAPLKQAVGPTPQRDGKTLGLFDLLSESGGSTATPTADRLASLQRATIRTPSKRKFMDTIVEEEEEEEETLKPERTPASSGKRFMLSSLFATPPAFRYTAMVDSGDSMNVIGGENQELNDAATQEAFDCGTPSFLRRLSSNRCVSGATDGFSPTAVRKPRTFVGKGLSAIVQGLRDMEEERLQGDMDALHEIEAEMDAASAQADDSQEPGVDTPPPRKKKGQKRTTRRVIMRPVVVPRPPEEAQADGPDDGTDGEDTAIQETELTDAARGAHEKQLNNTGSAVSFNKNQVQDLGTGSNCSDSSDTEGEGFTVGVKEAATLLGRPQSISRQAKKEKKPGTRKVNPEAHANYRALKIRSKGTKGRFARRFGRR